MAAEPDVQSMLGAFAALPDPLHTKNRRHLLLDVVVLAMLGVDGRKARVGPRLGPLAKRLESELQRLQANDGDMGLRPDPATGGWFLSAASEPHLEALLRRLRRDTKLALEVGPPQVLLPSIDGASFEPWMLAEIVVPEAVVPSVLRDWTARRGVLFSATPFHDHLLLEGEAPLAELLGYADDLRRRTNDEGAVAFEFARWSPRPIMDPQQPPPMDPERSLVEGLEQFADDLEAGVEIEKKYRVRRVVREPETPKNEAGDR